MSAFLDELVFLQKTSWAVAQLVSQISARDKDDHWHQRIRREFHEGFVFYPPSKGYEADRLSSSLERGGFHTAIRSARKKLNIRLEPRMATACHGCKVMEQTWGVHPFTAWDKKRTP